MRTLSAALHARVTGDATVASLCPGGMWLDVAPPPAQAARPVVVFSLRGAPIEGESMRCDAIVRRFTYGLTVEGTQDQAAAVRNAAARLEDLLHRTPWTATGWHIARVAFTDVTERAYVDGDSRLFAVIGQLEIVAEQS